MTGGGKSSVVFLLDVDGTLVDEEQIQRDLWDHLDQECGNGCRERYEAILEQLRRSLGYYDYLGALQRHRVEHPRDNMWSLASFLIDYPYANRLYPNALDLIKHFRGWGPVVILSDGDVIFQPRKIERSGIRAAAGDNVLIHVHKEDALPEVEELYPSKHYVVIDHSLHTLAEFRQFWGSRATIILSRDGKSAQELAAAACCPSPDIAVDRIGDLLNYDLPSLLARGEIEVAR